MKKHKQQARTGAGLSSNPPLPPILFGSAAAIPKVEEVTVPYGIMLITSGNNRKSSADATPQSSIPKVHGSKRDISALDDVSVLSHNMSKNYTSY